MFIIKSLLTLLNSNDNIKHLGHLPDTFNFYGPPGGFFSSGLPVHTL